MNYIYLKLNLETEELTREDYSRARSFLFNGAANKFIYYKKDDFLEIYALKELCSKFELDLRKESFSEIFAKFDDDIYCKINISCLWLSEVKLYPLEPLKKKSDLIDLACYIDIALKFCENFPIDIITTHHQEEAVKND